MKRIILFGFSLILILVSCKKDVSVIPSFAKDEITGLSQKGPFLNGSSLTLYELDANYSQTGKSFNTQILDNLGSFQVKNITTLTSFVKLKAGGFYFNEISNSNSLASITLYALSDLTNKNSVNVNLLSTLEASRAEYLIGVGNNFTTAKKQAQQEVLKIFAIKKTSMAESEVLDISQNTDDNAALLAISLILQGYRTEAELTQLIGDINTDIRTDGLLNSASLGTALINDAKLFNLPAIRSNIQNRYTTLGVITTIPNFEKYITQFIDSTNYTFTKKIQYPYIYNSKQNLLKDTVFPVISGTQYGISAFLPKGTSLKVLVRATPGFSTNCCAGPFTSSNSGWTISVDWPDSTVFRATGNDQNVYVPFMFGPPTSADFFIYENGSSVPTRTKTIIAQ